MIAYPTEIEGYLVGSGKLVKDVIGGGDNDTDAGLDVGGIDHLWFRC